MKSAFTMPYRDPGIQIIPTLGPRVCKYYLHWVFWNGRSYRTWLEHTAPNPKPKNLNPRSKAGKCCSLPIHARRKPLSFLKTVQRTSGSTLSLLLMLALLLLAATVTAVPVPIDVPSCTVTVPLAKTSPGRARHRIISRSEMRSEVPTLNPRPQTLNLKPKTPHPKV